MNNNDFINSLKKSNYINEIVTPSVGTYETFTSPFNVEYFHNIVAAIYLEYKRLYPDIEIFILYRVKSNRSFQNSIFNNTKKKSTNSNESTSINDLLSDESVAASIKNSIAKDILGMKIIISKTPNTLSFDRSNPENSEIFDLYSQKLDNLNFIERLNKWLSGASEEFQSEEVFYDYYIELLQRLENCIYEQCTNESVSTQLNNAIVQREALRQNNTFTLDVSDQQLDLLRQTLASLIQRLEDKLQHKILDVTLPKVLSTDLIKNVLHVHGSLDPSPNKNHGWKFTSLGYVARYSNLATDSDMTIELQGQSWNGYQIDKGGLAFHNGMPGKAILIKSFFKLKNPNDEQALDYYIDILKKVSFSVIESTNPRLAKNKKIALNALEHIELNDKAINPSLFDGRTPLSPLEIFASCVTPDSGTTHAGHNSFQPTVSLERKSKVEGLTDVLRDRNGLSVIAKMLIDKYIDLYGHNNSIVSYTEKSIRNFAEKNKDKITGNIDLSTGEEVK